MSEPGGGPGLTVVTPAPLPLQESEDAVKALAKEKDLLEREKWELRRQAKEATDHATALRSQLDLKDNRMKELEAELAMVSPFPPCPAFTHTHAHTCRAGPWDLCWETGRRESWRGGESGRAGPRRGRGWGGVCDDWHLLPTIHP